MGISKIVRKEFLPASYLIARLEVAQQAGRTHHLLELAGRLRPPGPGRRCVLRGRTIRVRVPQRIPVLHLGRARHERTVEREAAGPLARRRRAGPLVRGDAANLSARYQPGGAVVERGRNVILNTL